MATNPSTYMNLPVPAVSLEPGPAWATDINNSLTIIDQHNHTSGSGVQVPPAGLNINADLTFQNNNLTDARSLRMFSQSAVLALASDLDCLYVVGADLYYNDGVGNNIRITQSGGVVGTPGSISNLTSPASASYVSADQTFVWQSAANTSASMDSGPLTIRNNTSNSSGVTVSPPVGLASDYSLVLPALPASLALISLDSSGNMGSPTLDNVTLGVVSNIVKVKDLGINTAQIANGAVTNAKLAAVGTVISSSSGVFSSTALYPTVEPVTNLSVTLTTTGRPVMITLIPDGANESAVGAFTSSAGGAVLSFIIIQRDGVEIARSMLGRSAAGLDFLVPPGSIAYLDLNATAASHTYAIAASTNTASTTITHVYNCKLLVYEI